MKRKPAEALITFPFLLGQSQDGGQNKRGLPQMWLRGQSCPQCIVKTLASLGRVALRIKDIAGGKPFICAASASTACHAHLPAEAPVPQGCSSFLPSISLRQFWALRGGQEDLLCELSKCSFEREDPLLSVPHLCLCPWEIPKDPTPHPGLSFTCQEAFILQERQNVFSFSLGCMKKVASCAKKVSKVEELFLPSPVSLPDPDPSPALAKPK